MERAWEPNLQWNRVAPLPPPPRLFPKPGGEPVPPHCQATEISLWTLLAAIQAVERKVDGHTGQFQTLQQRADWAERQLSAMEKVMTDFLPHLEVLATMVQAYGQLQRRLEMMEERLKNPNFWGLNIPPGAERETPQVPTKFGHVTVCRSERELEDSNTGPKAHQKTEESLLLTDCAIFKPSSLPATEGRTPLNGEHPGPSCEAQDVQQDRAEAAVLLPTSIVADTEPGTLHQFTPLPVSSEQDVLPSLEERLVLLDSQMGAPQLSTESGGDVANFTTIVVQEGVLPGEAPYICPHCGRSFLYEEQCTLHQQSHLQASSNHGESPTRHPPPEVMAYTCPDCGRLFPHQASLSKHRLWHTADRPHTCAKCQKSFRLKINLQLHERTHAVAKHASCYICGQCGRAFNHHSNFLRHQMIHTGERPYACEECGKTFIRKEHLATHRRMHTGERPYQCPLCLKSFTRKQHLVGHQRLHEGEAIWLEDPSTQMNGYNQQAGFGVQGDYVALELGQETYPP